MALTRRAFSSLALGGLAAAPLPAQTAPPNVVLILADDLGYGDAGAYNKDAKFRTPHIDSLARDGVRFTDAHSPSAVCTPTRYGLLTGRYCWRSAMKQGVLNGWSPNLIEPGRETLATLARRRGYATGGFGKWHLGLGAAAKTDYGIEQRPSPNDHGFDEYFGIPASLDMPPYLFFHNRRAIELPTSTIADSGAPPRGAFWRGGPIAPSFKMEDVLPVCSARACEFIARHAGRRPFFTYIPLASPHTPWVPNKPFIDRSSAGLYGDFMQEIDDAIGRVLAQIERSGAAANTLVILTSDNGAPWSELDARNANGHWANAPWRGQKGDAYEGGHRVPFIARWPAHIAPGRVEDETLCLTDLFATMASLLDIPMRPGMGEDSFDMLPALLGRKRPGPLREATIMHSSRALYSIRQGDWKLIEGLGSGGFTQPALVAPEPGGPSGQLYNLREDPREQSNLWSERPQDVKRLTELLDRYRQAPDSRPGAA